MKKVSILAMVLVLCLAAVGIGYAGWTDKVNIDGTLTTGNLDIVLEELSGTDVYKNLDNHDMIVTNWTQELGQDKVYDADLSGLNLELIASSGADAVAIDDDGVTMTFDNLFPIFLDPPTDNQPVYFEANAVWHYVGSVPARIQNISVTVTDDNDETDPKPNLADDMNFLGLDCQYSLVQMRDLDDGNGYVVINDAVDEGTQLHNCDLLKLVVKVNVPENNSLMDIALTGHADIDLIQWNEYQP
jgi:hypothetical protein